MRKWSVLQNCCVLQNILQKKSLFTIIRKYIWPALLYEILIWVLCLVFPHPRDVFRNLAPECLHVFPPADHERNVLHLIMCFFKGHNYLLTEYWPCKIIPPLKNRHPAKSVHSIRICLSPPLRWKILIMTPASAIGF